MAAANGFVTVAPDARYGDVNGDYPGDYIFASQFTVPGTDPVEVTEIGQWVGAIVGTLNVVWAIFENDAANGCPGAIVADSQTSVVNHGSEPSPHQISFTYVTKPQLTGGATYWIAATQDTDNYISRFATGGTTVYKDGQTYGAWPTDTGWHSHADQSTDSSFYAVYAVVEAGEPGAGTVGSTLMVLGVG